MSISNFYQKLNLKSPEVKNCFILRVHGGIFSQKGPQPPSMHDKIENKQKLNFHYYRMDRWTGQATVYKDGQMERLYVVARLEVSSTQT